MLMMMGLEPICVRGMERLISPMRPKVVLCQARSLSKESEGLTLSYVYRES